MIRAVIDTSVLVSAIITPSGPNAQIFALIAADEIRPYERLKHLSRVRIASFRGLREKTATKVKTGGPAENLRTRRGQPHLRMRPSRQSRLHHHRERAAFSEALQDHWHCERSPVAQASGNRPGLRLQSSFHRAAPLKTPLSLSGLPAPLAISCQPGNQDGRAQRPEALQDRRGQPPFRQQLVDHGSSPRAVNWGQLRDGLRGGGRKRVRSRAGI